jgi:hypothetical protein
MSALSTGSHANRGDIRRILFPLLFCACVAGVGAVESNAPRWYYPVIKRPPDEPVTREPVLTEERTLRIAGGEYELAMIGTGDAPRRLIIDSRTIPTGYTLSVYYLPPFEVRRKTRWFDPRSMTGEWFDPCVPLDGAPGDDTVTYDLDAIAAVDSSGDAADEVFLLVEVHAARDRERVGDFPIRAYVETTDRRVRALPVLTVEPFQFDLPATHSLPLLAGLQPHHVFEFHRSRGLLPAMEDALWFDYLTILRQHRIVPYEGSPTRDFDWNLFERWSIPLYRGELTPDRVPAPAIRFPDNPYPRGTEERADFFRDVAARLRDAGLLDRAFYYVDDEPLIDDYAQIIADVEEIRRVVPGLPTLVTEIYTPQLDGYIDIWCPDIPVYQSPFPVLPLYGKGSGLQPDFQVAPDISIYENQQESGRELWMYTCTSAQFLAFPNLFIDAESSAHRIIPWFLESAGATGMVYFRVNHAYRDGNDPWYNQYYFAANGDGTLLYPAHPDLPWFSEHGAVASLRLKILRDGLEDYEYLRLAPAHARALSPVGSARSFERDLAELVAIRDEIGALIDQPGGPAPEPLRFNQVSQPSIATDLWYLPSWTSGEHDGGFFGVSSYRHLLVSALDTGRRSSSVANRGRWQVYLQAGPLYGIDAPGIRFGGYSALGWTVSLETAERLNRSWLIPYLGVEGGVLTVTGGDSTATAFAGSVLGGLHIWSAPRTSLSIGGAWTHTTSSRVPVAFRGTLSFDFVLGGRRE